MSIHEKNPIPLHVALQVIEFVINLLITIDYKFCDNFLQSSRKSQFPSNKAIIYIPWIFLFEINEILMGY